MIIFSSIESKIQRNIIQNTCKLSYYESKITVNEIRLVPHYTRKDYFQFWQDEFNKFIINIEHVKKNYNNT